MKNLLLILIALSLAGIFWSCEKEKSGVIDPQLNTPRLLSAATNRTIFNLDSVDTDITVLAGHRYTIRCSVNALASAQYNPKAVSSNGIFYPVIVVNGQVIGVWKRIFKKDKVRVLTHFFQSPDALTKSLIKEEANRLGRFLNKNTEIDL